jgi:SAM-dependent methyltransferase
MLMPRFSQRSYKKELLDRDDIPFEDIKENMQELDTINRLLGGHSITVKGFDALVPLAKKNAQNQLSVLEIGCGGGDNLRVIRDHCLKKNISVTLSGLDINPHCIEFAISRKENKGIDFFTSDYRAATLQSKPDIIFSSLFCHHFTDEGVIEIFSWMKRNAATGFFINDLHRHPLAYYSIKALSGMFSKNYLVKNDAPLSVLRGFSRNELKDFAAASLTEKAEIKWKWAFRWLMIFHHE